MKTTTRSDRRPAPWTRPLGTQLGTVFGAQLQIVRARMEMRANERHLEEVARQVGADLCDPEQFRIAQELADAA